MKLSPCPCLVGLPSTRSKVVSSGVSCGVLGAQPLKSKGLECAMEASSSAVDDDETSRMVVVGPDFPAPVLFLGVPSPIPKLRRETPMLNRALSGAGAPGRSICPGSGALSSLFVKSNFDRVLGVGGSALKCVKSEKWSVCGIREGDGVAFFVSSSSMAVRGREPRVWGERTFRVTSEELLGSD